jgi:bifunctional UDP-N-acetylglucosamine pyrophosphorylase/glucosamine-1-phosphate N-acetyltransferase
MQCFVLASSRGERLEPFTRTRPKTLIPIANQPALAARLAQCAAAGLSDATVILGYRGPMIRERFSAAPSLPLAVSWSTVPTDGTAFATIAAAAAGDCLLVDGDVYGEPELLPALLATRSDADVVILLAHDLNPLYHYRATLAGDRVTALEPVTAMSRSQDPSLRTDEESAGMYAGACLVRGAARGLLADFGRSDTSGSTVDFIRFCLSRGVTVAAATSPARFANIDYPWELFAAKLLSEELFRREAAEIVIAPSAEVSPQAQLRGRVIIGERVRVAAGAVISNATIGDDTDIRENTHLADCFVGRQCAFGPMAYAANSAFGDHSHAGPPAEAPQVIAFGPFGASHHCHAGTGVYGEGVSLHAGVIVTAWRGQMVKMRIKDELLSTGCHIVGAFLGDRSVLNANALIMPGRKIGTGAVVGPGVILYRDLPPHRRIIVRQQTEEDTVYQTGRRIINPVPAEVERRVREYFRERPACVDVALAAEELGLPEELIAAVMSEEWS